MFRSNFYFFILIIFFSGATTFRINAQLKPTKTKAVVTFFFQNPANNNPVVGKKFKLESEKSKQNYNLETNNTGKASLLLPINDVYKVHLTNWENFASVTIPKGEYQRHEIPVPYYEIPKDGTPVNVDIPVHIRLVTKAGNPNKLIEVLTIRSGNIRKTYQITTNENGIAILKLPIGCKYMLSLDGAPNYYKFEIPNRPYAAWTEDVIFERIAGMEKYPSFNNALFNFVFYDLDGNLTEGEKFWVRGEKENKRYEALTNKQGIAQILVPVNDIYSLNTSYNHNFARQEMILEKGSDIIVETVIYESITSKAWNKRRQEQALAAARRDSLTKIESNRIAAKFDSLKKAGLDDRAIADLIKNKCSIPIKRTFRIRKAVRVKVEIIQEQLKVNPNYFEDENKPVLAILERFKESWKGKLVVTDITQSMKPYLEEVLIWHILNLREGEHCKYIFFNDGDKKMESAKKTGSTGGIYLCEGSWDDLSQIIETMHIAMESGLGGGAPPENDLEAVLAGIDQKKEVEELILIADSYSRVRDMSLLSQVNIPIRIILCGAEEKNDFYNLQQSEINEEYLTIAHRTKGSIHTLRQDILDLSDRKEGEIVEIGTHRYVLRNRQFIKLR